MLWTFHGTRSQNVQGRASFHYTRPRDWKMSWTRQTTAYQAYSVQATRVPTVLPFSPWELRVWEVTNEFPAGRRYNTTDAGCLQNKAKLRIIFAPVDLPRRDALEQTLALFSVLNVPNSFTTERTQSVSHSFARRTDKDGCSSWFHFLCKNIQVRRLGDGTLEVNNGAAALGSHPKSMLPEEDLTWNHSAFFLRADNDGTVSLACFGAMAKVKARIDEFIAARAWDDVFYQPYILFDLILEGLYFEVDNIIWNIGLVFGSRERAELTLANAVVRREAGSKTAFTALHNCAKHIIFLSEALDSCIMVIDAISSSTRSHDSTAKQPLVLTQLKECLQYRRSLFCSSQLRLRSFQKRIDNAITLSFNLVTQQDSLLMIQDSNTMKLIAAITMIFLPTTGVATVAGSQLLLTTREKGEWNVAATPLFWLTWWISIPLTVFVATAGLLWHWWTRREHPRIQVIRFKEAVTTVIRRLWIWKD